ncbi:MAG: class II aldolase/adducin family protein, partial [Gemmatimonadetes bacterium]|nr:class II aldolase/adducin family protein [Gemmatimonadota bacterium]
MSAFTTLKEEAWEANQALVRHGLVIETFGNASAFDGERGVCAIKPSGLAYEDMDPGSMVLVDLEGSV